MQRFQIIPNMFETFSCNIPEYCKTFVFGGYLFFGAFGETRQNVRQNTV